MTNLFNIAVNRNITAKTGDRLIKPEILSVLRETEISRKKPLKNSDTCTKYVCCASDMLYVYLRRDFKITILNSSIKFVDAQDPYLQRNFLWASVCGDSQFRMSESPQTRFMSSALEDMSCNKTNEDGVIDPWMCVSFRKAVFSVCQNLLTPCLIPKLEDYQFLAFCIYFIQFILRSPAKPEVVYFIRNQKTRLPSSKDVPTQKMS
jgi:hypothetical protein